MDIRIALENETVASVGYPKPVVVQKDSTVKSAVDTMAREKTGCILIQDGETLVGIFTERDFISRVLDNRDAFGQPIKDFMTPDPLVAKIDEPLYQVLSRFLQHDVRNLPVLDKKHLPVGILPVRRVVHFLADYHPTTVYNLPPDPKQMHSSPEGG